MNKVRLTITIFLISFLSFGQTKSYVSKTIGKWTFEKFPVHYLIEPFKKTETKDPKTQRLISYNEVNNLGQLNGLSLDMDLTGKYPSSAIYTYKGQLVYNTTFFPNSNVAKSITTYNEKGQLDGYKIYRTLKSTGGYKEDIEKYIDGALVEINGVKKKASGLSFKDSLLDGDFRFNVGVTYYEGIAEKGKLLRIKEIYDDKYPKDEYVFFKDSLKIISQEKNDMNFKVVNNILLTNSKNLCLKYGNLNGYPYLLIPKDFNLYKIYNGVLNFYPEKLETKINFKDSLLDGDFEYRYYDFSREGLYEDIVGNASSGQLTKLSITKVKYSIYDGKETSKNLTEYIFSDLDITINEYDLLKSKEIKTSRKAKILKQILLTNSKVSGGYYKHNQIDEALKIPKFRDSQLIDNKPGFYFFEPNSFDFLTFINLLTK